MNHFHSDISKSTNTVVYFNWKTIIYIYACGQCRTQFILPNLSRRQYINMYIYDGKVSHMHRRMCWWNYTPSINRSCVSIAKEGRHVRIVNIFVIYPGLNENYIEIIVTDQFINTGGYMSIIFIFTYTRAISENIIINCRYCAA